MLMGHTITVLMAVLMTIGGTGVVLSETAKDRALGVVPTAPASGRLARQLFNENNESVEVYLSGANAVLPQTVSQLAQATNPEGVTSVSAPASDNETLKDDDVRKAWA
jgi:hypothetical protein